ncbi:MarR family winged helix-turn-helix transcriptional regulator [Macrococcus epidermidis]|uniref:MarR family winged helix-turn-helix transcriptional regulator n=1 Tax=Macrococcus epidermidis TaxID=1902580 RepID=UPI0020B76165|nr:MarR family winged helix-turn-helix transcriptional regulator [Macrococcus epidermidis]UTH15973.1 winged helix-turn-helix transcriptional regulator [Macrococcus epidermidis]
MIELEQSLFKTVSLIEANLNESLSAAYGISYTEFLILYKLYLDEESTIAEIQKDISYKMDSASTKTKKLRAMGLIAKERRKDDERKVATKLTDEGHALVEEIKNKYNKHLTTSSTKLSERDLQTLKSLIDSYRDDFHANFNING